MAQGDEHRRYEDFAVAHVLGGLDQTESRTFRTHLLDCPDCRARVGELRAIAHELADVERDERRSRAAQTLETKERDDGDGEPPPSVHDTRRFPRLLLTAAVLGLLALSLWNFTLRGAVVRLQENIDRQSEAAALIEFGVPGLVLAEREGVDGQLKAAGDRMAVLVQGLDDATVYGVYIQDASGQVIFRLPVQAREGRYLASMAVPDDAHTLLLTKPDGTVPTAPEGATVFHVRLPQPG